MMITFYEEKTGLAVGSVTLDNGKLIADPAVADIVQGWTRGPKEFIKRYTQWSNGYLSSRLG